MKYIEELKLKHSHAKRVHEHIKLKQKYPDRTPVIVDSLKDNLDNIKNHKFLVPNDITLAQFMFIIRKQLTIKPEEALYFFISENKTMETGSKTISELTQKHADKDRFLYIYYDLESTFG